jgi:N4-gp56 family major capsid protein
MNYALKYADQVDSRFTLGSLTQGIINNNFDWIGVESVRVFSRDLATLGNYALTGTSRYGTPDDLGNAVQEMQITQDKAFTYIIDKKTEQDTMGTMEAAATLAENIDNVVIPALDTYRLAKLVAGAPTSGTYTEESHIVTAAVTAANAYTEFLKVQEILDNDKAPMGGRVAVVNPAFFNFIKLDENFVKRGDMATQIAINGVVGEIDGVPVIKVPKIYLPENVDFVITNPMVMPSPVKLQEFKIHDNAPGISGYLVEARIRYDSFVLNKKKDAIGVHKSA